MTRPVRMLDETMKVLVVGAGLAGVLLAATGCGGSSDPEPGSPASMTAPQTSVTTTVASSDEQLITELVEQEAAAFAAWDLDTIVELTCQKYRKDARAAAQTMTEFATLPLLPVLPSESSAASPTETADVVREAFPTASEATIERVVDAVVRSDEAAIDDAMDQLLAETTSVKIEKIENITVTGDSATADVTTTAEALGQPPETKTDHIPFVREDGQWKDCEDPNP